MQVFKIWCFVNPAPQGIDLPADRSVSKMDNKIIINYGTPELEKASKSLLVPLSFFKNLIFNIMISCKLFERCDCWLTTTMMWVEQDSTGCILTQGRGSWTNKRAWRVCHWLIFRWLEWDQSTKLTTPAS